MRRRRLRIALLALGLLLVGLAAPALADPPKQYGLSDAGMLPPPPAYGDTPAWDRFSVWQFYFDGDYGIMDTVTGAPIVNFIVSAFFRLLAFLVKFVIYMVHWAFTTKLVVYFVSNFVAPLLNVLRNALFWPYAFVPITAAGVAALYFWLRREVSRATSTLTQTFVVLLVATFSFMFLPEVIISVDDGVTSMASVVMAEVATVDPDLRGSGTRTQEAALRQLGESLWHNLVIYPWCQAEFGSIFTCIEHRAEGVHGGEVLKRTGNDRERYIAGLPTDHKKMMQAEAVGIRFAMLIVFIPLVILLGGVFAVLAASLLGNQLMLALWASILPGMALTALFPERAYQMHRWVMRVFKTIFMKLAVALLIGMASAASSVLWRMDQDNWMLGSIFNIVLAVVAYRYRGIVYGSIVGAFDGVQGAVGQTVDAPPTRSFLGGAVADVARRRVGGAVLAGLGAVVGTPLLARAALANRSLRGLASESLMRRYTLDKEQAASRRGGQPSELVKAADARRSQGLNPFSPEQIAWEMQRLQRLKASGEDPRRVLNRPGLDPAEDGYAEQQRVFDRTVDATKQELRPGHRSEIHVAKAVQNRTPAGRLSGAITRLYPKYRPPARTPLTKNRLTGGPELSVVPPGPETDVVASSSRTAVAQPSGSGRTLAEHRSDARHGMTLRQQEPVQPYVLQRTPITRDGRIIVPVETIQRNPAAPDAADQTEVAVTRPPREQVWARAAPRVAPPVRAETIRTKVPPSLQERVAQLREQAARRARARRKKKEQ